MKQSNNPVIAIYGGSFNPPHKGHLQAARAAIDKLQPDKFFMVPSLQPPHKEMAQGSPDETERLRLLNIAAKNEKDITVSDMELRREGPSYSCDSVEQLSREYPGAKIYLLMGADMLLSFETWYKFRWILENASLAVFTRADGQETQLSAYSQHLRDNYDADIRFIPKDNTDISSTELRESLKNRQGREYLDDKVYARIISRRLYGAKPDFDWLRERAHSYLHQQRIDHVVGCELEAQRLARHWGADPESAREAAILHDITKKLSTREQLILCEKYGIITDKPECNSEKLLHAKTGSALAKDEFGVSDDVASAIYWHTTGRANMTLLEEIIYMADYIEPNRNFDRVEELRELAYDDLDKAMALGLEMTMDELRAKGVETHKNSRDALQWFRRRTQAG